MIQPFKADKYSVLYAAGELFEARRKRDEALKEYKGSEWGWHGRTLEAEVRTQEELFECTLNMFADQRNSAK